MYSLKSYMIFAVVFVFGVFASGEEDPAVASALKDTKDLLKNKSQREELFKKDERAKTANSQVDSVTGGNAAQSQQIYDISSDAFSSVMQNVGNDPNKAMELLQKAQGNPEAFFKSLPPEVQAKIRGVASDIEKNGKTKNNP